MVTAAPAEFQSGEKILARATMILSVERIPRCIFMTLQSCVLPLRPQPQRRRGGCGNVTEGAAAGDLGLLILLFLQLFQHLQHAPHVRRIIAKDKH